jgi:hypothetical protein
MNTRVQWMLLVALAASVCADGAPKVVWGQTEAKVFLTAKMKCDKPAGCFRFEKLTADTLHLSCIGADAEGGDVQHALKFTLRDDIDPARSSCKTTRNGEECVLHKLVPHKFDRLTHDEGELRGRLKYNTELADGLPLDDGEDDEAKGEDRVYEDDADAVPKLTARTLAEQS